MDGSLRVLLVEDDIDYAKLVKKRLRNFNPQFQIETTSSADSCMEKISSKEHVYEAIILDYQLPEYDGLDILGRIKHEGIDVPVVMVSGQGSEMVAVEALKKGAYDYLIKDKNFLSVLPNVLQKTIEKHQLELMLRESRQKYQNMFDGISDIIYQVDQDYQIISANKSFADHCRTEPRNLIGRKCHEVSFNLKQPCTDCPVKDAIGSMSSKSVEKSHEGQVFEMKSYPIFNSDKHVESVAVYSKNITEKKTLEKSLIQSEKLATIGLLASGVAHEIRNPLNIIETARYYLTEFLKDQDSDITEKLEIIGKNVRRTSKIISNLLEFSRNSDNEREAINLNRLIESTVSLIGKELTAKNIEFVFDCGSTHFAHFSIDAIKQVLLNVIINSIQAMPNGGCLTVKIDQETTDAIDIHISDTGVGISSEDLPHIFSPFFTTKEVGVGTGLGLYISHMILAREGGEIKAHSQTDKGTTFTVSLPASIEESDLQ
jgi:polar amino acid transport system substrate-binding protein